MNEYFEIFRSGLHTDSNGNQKEWTEEDLNRIAKTYNDQTAHEAPLVIGHPETNQPAYGWVESLKVEGSKLLAKASQIVPEFVEALKSGLFKKRSISLYPDMLLRHVGFLGAMPPAVKGLADLEFSTEPDCLTIDFDEEISGKTITIEPESKSNQKTEPEGSDIQVQQFNEQLAIKDSRIKELETNISKMESSARLKDFNQMLTNKVKSGNITPAQSEILLSFFNEIEQWNLTLVSFAESKHPRDFLKEFIEKQPRFLPEQPVIPTTEPEEKTLSVDEVAKNAREYVEKQQKNGKTVTYAEAVKAVTNQA
jgi:hypothetical protein